MLPLAVTSTAGWIRRLGGARWQKLHRLIYLSAVAGAIHYYWLVKSDVRLPLAYGSAVGVLLLYRIVEGYKPSSPEQTAKCASFTEYSSQGASVEQRLHSAEPRP